MCWSQVFANGVHLSEKWDEVVLWRTSFPSLTGILTLSFFIHNSVTSIMKNAKRPEHNARDLMLAYMFVSLTYLTVGFLFYIGYRDGKSHILNNFLQNCANDDILALVARLFLLFQVCCVPSFRRHLFSALFVTFPSLAPCRSPPPTPLPNPRHSRAHVCVFFFIFARVCTCCTDDDGVSVAHVHYSVSVFLLRERR